MRLEIASLKAIRYACKHFHYSKSVPVNPFGFSVFNDKNEWCGTVVYSLGANKGLGKPYKLINGEVCELTRMALNGKQEVTSKVLSFSLKQIPKSCPLIKLIISFADEEQKHIGIIYQATNFYFCGKSNPANEYIFKGKRFHGRGFRKKYGSHLKYIDKGLKIINGSSKFRYIYPIDKSLIPMCKELSKPYPKKCDSSLISKAPANHAGDGGHTDLIAQP